MSELDSDGRRRLTVSDWAEIEELWQLGEHTLVELGEKFGVTPEHLSRELAKRGIKKGTKAGVIKERVQELVANKQMERAAQNVERIQETKEDHYSYAKALSRMMFTIIATRVKNKQSVAGVKEEVRTIRDALQGMEIARKERYAILGLDKDEKAGDEITPLVIKEMTAEDVEQLRNRQRMESGDPDLAEVDNLIDSLGDDGT